MQDLDSKFGAAADQSDSSGKEPRNRQTNKVLILQQLRCWSFSLRTWMILVTFLCLGFGILFQRIDQTRKIVDRIETAGGMCRFTQPQSQGSVTKWFRGRLGRFGRSYFGKVDHVTVPPDCVDLDEVLKDISQLSSLESLNLEQSIVSDSGLGYLAEISSLQEISLDQARVSDSGLGYLAEISSLQEISLDHARVSDSGVVQLAKLKSLKALSLKGTKVSYAVLRKLSQELPDCVIYGPTGWPFVSDSEVEAP